MSGATGLPEQLTTRLRTVFDDARTRAAGIGPAVVDATDVLADFVLGGGKRVRPRFAEAGRAVAHGARAVVPAADDTDAALVDLGAALELVQACALVHDDIIDASDTRRGNPTVHRVFAARHAGDRWLGDPDRFGESMAILIGDLALAWADDLAAGLPARLAPTWRTMRTEVLAGQLLDIVNEAGRDESLGAAEKVIRFKTAGYTVARPLELGAVLGGADDDLVAALRTIGLDLGAAFQLRDDLLGVYGDPRVTGKPSGDDLVTGKRTVLIAEGFSRSAPGQADELRTLLGTDLDDAGLARARAILTESGAQAAVEARIDSTLASALSAIDSLPTSTEARDRLAGLAHDITHRAA
ncbi:polyprenyl synthetase family protein [Gordonia sp. X0973]|uniref:polyprenyl synthetase family protein n=1 Tax=Gordonia sp. X0973 TaxID=2742602 RepID=UPI000F51F43F|nr:polyprenyl synthetase family protein [Gordonia sp. X0973]QKT07593.1 polyprenyl synthetase family protein [Gordonia sp. X0973]